MLANIQFPMADNCEMRHSYYSGWSEESTQWGHWPENISPKELSWVSAFI